MDNLDEMEAIFNTAKKRIITKEIKTAHDEKILKDDSSHEGEFREKDPLEKVLIEVDRLVQNHAFTEAKLLLIKQRLRVQEKSALENIDQALKTVDLAEERYGKEVKTPVSPEREKIELATRLIEEENFEEAITKLNEIQDESGTFSETKKLKELAIEKLINKERNKAAMIFLQAKKTDDPAKKEELLISSYHILKSLIERYPSSNLFEKLNDHLQKVKDEMAKLKKETG